MLADLEAAATRILGGTPDLWHIHNHALGKNAIVPTLVKHLAEQGRKVLLQPHDFAEDGRPENYRFLRQHVAQGDARKLGECLYPQGTHVHYALINRRDWRFLQIAGVPERQLHYLPNAVGTETDDVVDARKKPAFDGRLFFYPARAIRRKNIGEFLLWAALAEQDDLFAIARAPKNPLARPTYDDWVACAQRLKLPVRFGLGEIWPGSFSSLLQAAHTLVSTSVAEGFGLAFLEPWVAGRPLVGRKLPEITDEFEHAGLDLSNLYTQLQVPLDWIGKDRFLTTLHTEFTRMYAAYGRLMQPDYPDRVLAAACTHGRVDFGRLDEVLQRLVIERLVHSAGARTEILPATLMPAEPLSAIAPNRQVVERQFHLLEYGRRLQTMYHTIAESPAESGPAMNADYLLEEFLAPERFCLLRT